LTIVGGTHTFRLWFYSKDIAKQLTDGINNGGYDLDSVSYLFTEMESRPATLQSIKNERRGIAERIAV